MHTFTFKHGESIITILAANVEAARTKLSEEVQNISDWKLQQ